MSEFNGGETAPISQFEMMEHIERGSFVLTLVGMSNVGKSRWSERMVEHLKFGRFTVDDIIEQQLASEIEIDGGIEAMSVWMGQPYEEQHPTNAGLYLATEHQSMLTIIEEIRSNTDGTNKVIDTTGSFAHLDPKVWNDLGLLSTIVYIQAGQLQRDILLERYKECPKPVVWGDHFTQQAGETQEAALVRCYPDLLAWRDEQFMTMADVVLPYTVTSELDTPNQFLEHVHAGLAA